MEALIARRRQSGLDKYDEVWDGDYHMVPMAHSSHGRIQAQVMHLLVQWADAAGLVVTGPFNLGEPGNFRVPDAAEVDEVLVVDGERRQVSWLRRDGDWFAPADSSALLGPGSAALSDLISWPR